MGWDLALRGYTSILWRDLHRSLPSMSIFNQNWDNQLVTSLLSLHKQICDNRNSVLHGTTWLDSKQKLCTRIIEEVKLIYDRPPPKLHSRFQKVSRMPLKDRLNHNTGYLQHWISRVKHQQKVSQSLHLISLSSQITIKEAFHKAWQHVSDKQKFPP
jgi:hypothetical protein